MAGHAGKPFILARTRSPTFHLAAAAAAAAPRFLFAGAIARPHPARLPAAHPPPSTTDQGRTQRAPPRRIQAAPVERQRRFCERPRLAPAKAEAVLLLSSAMVAAARGGGGMGGGGGGGVGLWDIFFFLAD
jgi:hypothetical protein